MYPTRSLLKFSTLTLIITFAFISIASATDIGTIKLKNGEVYKDVPYELNDYYKIVIFTFGDQKIRAEYSELESITAQNSQDTVYQALQMPEIKRNFDFEEEIIQIVPWSGIISLGGNFSLPTGPYFSGLTAGIGFNGDARFSINDHIALQFSIARSRLGFNNDVNIYVNNPGWYVFKKDISFHANRYAMALNFYKSISDNNRSIWYNIIGAGVAGNTFSVEATFRNADTGLLEKYKDSKSEYKYLVMVGVGSVRMVSKHIGMDFSGTADLVVASTGNGGIPVSPIIALKISGVFMF
jgi:hypothetical protein